MDFLFWLAIVNNIFSVFGFTGVMNQQKELVTGFFAYNAVQMIVAFHYFVDVCADVRIRYVLKILQLVLVDCVNAIYQDMAVRHANLSVVPGYIMQV